MANVGQLLLLAIASVTQRRRGTVPADRGLGFMVLLVQSLSRMHMRRRVLPLMAGEDGF